MARERAQSHSESFVWIIGTSVVDSQNNPPGRNASPKSEDGSESGSNLEYGSSPAIVPVIGVPTPALWRDHYCAPLRSPSARSRYCLPAIVGAPLHVTMTPRVSSAETNRMSGCSSPNASGVT